MSGIFLPQSSSTVFHNNIVFVCVYFPDQFCDPLGDYNVWGTLYPIKEAPKKGDIVVAAAKVRIFLANIALSTSYF